MYLIDATSFIGKIDVPNTQELQGEANENLDLYVDEKVRLFLQEKLGSELFEDLDDNITSGVLDVVAPQKWKNLVNGCNYTKDGKTFTWRGLCYKNGLIPKSLLANYVFTFWLEDSVSTVLGTGEARAEGKNSVSVNSTQRLVSAWNEFVEMYQGNDCSTSPNIYFVGGVPVVDYYQQSQSNYVAMVQFIKDNETDYPAAPLGLEIFRNQLGL